MTLANNVMILESEESPYQCADYSRAYHRCDLVIRVHVNGEWEVLKMKHKPKATFSLEDNSPSF